MAFDIPNLADAAFTPQAQLDSADFDMWALALGRTGVKSGCAVSAQGTPDMTVAVASGTCYFDGTEVAVSSGNVTITAAHNTYARFDLIVVNDSGTKSAVAGTASATPAFPAIPADSLVLATVYVPANDTAIQSNQISDRRITFTLPDIPTTWTQLMKSSDESVTNSTTVQDDDDLTFSMSASTKYRVKIRVIGTSAAGAGFKFNLAGPTSPTLVAGRVEFHYGSTTHGSVLNDAAWTISQFGGTDLSVGPYNFVAASFDLVVHNGSNSGTFKLQWSQSAASGTASILRAGSYLEYSTVS